MDRRHSMFRGYGEFDLCVTYFRAFWLFSFSFTCGSNCAPGDVTRLFTCVRDLIWEKWTFGSCAAKLERHDEKKTVQAGPGKKRSFFSDFFSLGNFDSQNELFIWVDREF